MDLTENAEGGGGPVVVRWETGVKAREGMRLWGSQSAGVVTGETQGDRL